MRNGGRGERGGQGGNFPIEILSPSPKNPCLVAITYNCETIIKRSECADQIASYNGKTTLLNYMSERSHNEEKDLPRSSINMT